MSVDTPPRSQIPEPSGPRGPWQRARYYASRLRPRRVAATIAWAWNILRQIWRRRRMRGGSRLTVAVDAAALWGNLTGIGWYLYRVLEHLSHHPELHLRLYGPRLAQAPQDPRPPVPLPQGPAIEWVHVECPEELTLPPWRLAELVERVRPLLAAADGNEVLFLPNFLLPGTLRLTRQPRLVTLHDLAFRLHPETLRTATLDDLTSHLPRTLSRARRIVTPTATVAQEVRQVGLAPGIDVGEILHGPGQLASQPGAERADAPADAEELPAAVPDAFVLHVGTVEPRKNLQVLFDAWRLLRERGFSPPPLVLVGGDGWKLEQLASQIAEGQQQGWLIRPGYVTNPELATLYRRARAVVFPTLYEGFGLPAVETQSAGTPLLASDIPVLREVAGEGALYCPPRDAEAWGQALERLLTSPQLAQDLIVAGHRNIQRFSWQRSAELHGQALLTLAGRDPSATEGS
ncbi:MAG: glycosyltransferase family 1 protein [Acidobacteriota bacterium]